MRKGIFMKIINGIFQEIILLDKRSFSCFKAIGKKDQNKKSEKNAIFLRSH